MEKKSVEKSKSSTVLAHERWLARQQERQLRYSMREPRTQSTKVDKKFFKDTLVEFRTAGHECTWSTEPPAVVLRFHDVPYSYSGYRKAAEALLQRIEEWKT
ncbi:unnamed protein product [marine sediment metagenome]|uniref:Uncharacterized protein n=1 Tax=marine sediment metagenome TaxID=412755 RepID=X1R246_9ZZZZ